MATGLEKISFHSNPKERQCQRMFKPTTQLHSSHMLARASLIAQLVKNLLAMQETPGLIPELGRSTGEGIGYPLQYSQASLVAQLVKTLRAMWETWVRSLGGEDPLEKGKATHSSILAWRIPWTIQSIGLQRGGHD